LAKNSKCTNAKTTRLMTNTNLFIAQTLNINEKGVANTIKLLNEGATVPFISRYRKEMTGSLDELSIIKIKEEWQRLQELDKRKQTVLKTIEEQGKLSPELKIKIDQCLFLNELEDIYLPYKPKKRTRASIAKEAGLEPLAQKILLQQQIDLDLFAEQFLNEKITTVNDALQGARDIIAEHIAEDLKARQSIRNLFSREAVISSKLVKNKEIDAQKYQDYFQLSEALKHCPSHRYLAMRRGEEEGYLKLDISVDSLKANEYLNKLFIKSNNNCSKQIQMAIEDAYNRLLKPSIENEFRAEFKEKADDEAILVFSENLRQLLMAAPLGSKRVLALDPGFRTGCKVVCLDENGRLLINDTIYPHPPQNENIVAAQKILSLIKHFKIEAIAIGNATAGRETEAFIKSLQLPNEILICTVSESGASVYSASEVAREELPDYDVTVRGSVSIGRRLIDPLAELVKIDPKSIGVGQYQHDVDQNKLKRKLDTIVESCVNAVGVELNTASPYLLTYVSGIGPQIAKNIVEYRNSKGKFESRNELKKVPRLGDKAFEQAAGFLRINQAKNPLDNSAVHPERYELVKQMAKDLNCTISDLLKNESVRKTINIKQYISEECGLPTLQDILNELAKPGRDPRETYKNIEFDDHIKTIEDLKIDLILNGIITNVTKFGAFVDIGIKENGLVHISNISHNFIKDPFEVVKLNQQVKVKVIEIDIARKRVALTMKDI
jgi:protein Tex